MAEGTYSLPQGFPIGVASIEIIVLDQTFRESAPFPIGYSGRWSSPWANPVALKTSLNGVSLVLSAPPVWKLSRHAVGSSLRVTPNGASAISVALMTMANGATVAPPGGSAAARNPWDLRWPAASECRSFLATTPGRYMCEIRVDGDRLVNTVLYVRSHCSVEEPVAELGCNDNAAELDIGLLSRVHFEASPRSPVFLFVDGMGAGFEAPYIVRCSLTERWPENPVE